MTKEEILDKAFGRNITPSPEMLSAMDEYTKYHGIRFLNWATALCPYERNENLQWEHIATKEIVTTEELYKLYIQQLK